MKIKIKEFIKILTEIAMYRLFHNCSYGIAFNRIKDKTKNCTINDIKDSDFVGDRIHAYQVKKLESLTSIRKVPEETNHQFLLRIKENFLCEVAPKEEKKMKAKEFIKIISKPHKNLIIKIFAREVKCRNSSNCEKITIKAGIAIPTNSLSASRCCICEMDLIDNSIVNKKNMVFEELLAPGWGSFNLRQTAESEKFLRGHRYRIKFFPGPNIQKTSEEAIDYCLAEINKI